MNKVRLNINKISPGMKLAEPITTPAGITLMPAGIRLTPMFIVRIKKWNVEELDVFVGENPGDGEQSASTKASPPPSAEKQDPATGHKTQQRKKPGEEKKLTAEEAEFARLTAIEVSRPFVNLKDNPVMMQLRLIVIKRLVKSGKDGAINILRGKSHPADEQEVG